MRTTDEKWPEGLSHCEVCFLGQSSLYLLPIIAPRKPEVSDKSPSQIEFISKTRSVRNFL